MVDLPEMPHRIARLPKDERGYPVPWFVGFFDKGGQPCPPGEGEPDFRIIAPNRIWDAVTHNKCWVCGIALGVHRVYVIGPMCVINRVTSEPPCHRDCAEFAARACPFLTRPRQKRDHKGLPEDAQAAAGIAIERNPGATALYETKKAKAFRPDGPNGSGILFRLGDPERIDWWARGRTATRAEVVESIESGLPLLMAEAQKQGREAIAELARLHAAAQKYLPAEGLLEGEEA